MTKRTPGYLEFLIKLDQRGNYMLVQMFLMLMFQTCAQYSLESLELWKLASYNGITMLPFGRAIAVHGSPFDALRDNLFGNRCILYIV